MLIDSHCHLQAEEFDRDRPDVIRRCQERGMQCIVVGNNQEDSGWAVNLAQDYDFLYAAVGLHPMFLLEESWEAQHYEKLLQQPKVVAIGEIGLDYYHIWADSKDEERTVKTQQAELLEKQLQFARDHHKPVILHCRDAYDDLSAILKNWKNVPMVVHTFLGDAKTAEKFLALGCVLSFSGIITFGNDEALQKTVLSVPLEKMLIETDAPLLTPVPFRGKRNEPIYVEEVAKCIAQLKNLPVASVIETTGTNAQKFFALSVPE